LLVIESRTVGEYIIVAGRYSGSASSCIRIWEYSSTAATAATLELCKNRSTKAELCGCTRSACCGIGCRYSTAAVGAAYTNCDGVGIPRNCWHHEAAIRGRSTTTAAVCASGRIDRASCATSATTATAPSLQ